MRFFSLILRLPVLARVLRFQVVSCDEFIARSLRRWRQLLRLTEFRQLKYRQSDGNEGGVTRRSLLRKYAYRSVTT